MGKSTDLDAAFGIALRRLRQSKKLTQEQLGFEAGLRRTFISSLELGEKQASLATIQKLAAVFDLTMAKFIQLVEKEL
ncbi:XRE family transcriptional regulator [Polynucleobacter tropicus]|uniref:XRE family transcriptional regulator n=1 Tax=Polynucleobacter tropicus TaxID=1743174 RepID=A0A6M9PQI7_9BURK|nr:helix-turn-helix transcriptional regulator [Polynucleobacter tropicus]QKM64644.1 XRE family transcriptional regulator [Polynucleobacter tropicus]